VTGGAGFIGSRVAQHLAEAGWILIVTWHTTRPRALHANCKLWQGDLAAPNAATDLLTHATTLWGTPPDALIHCAGRASDIGRNAAFRRANFEAVCSLATATAHTDHCRFVFVSSTDVYGLLDHTRADESTPMQEAPPNPYPHYKIEAERWLSNNIPPHLWSVVRPAAVWGPGDRTLTPRIVAFLRTSPFIIHFGPWRGTNRWPLAHVDRVARACHAAAILDEAAGKAVNVIDPEHTTMDAFYRHLAAQYFPQKHFRTLCIPFWVGWLFGSIITTLSNLLGRTTPLTDPSLYALYSVSRNLDFSDTRLTRWLQQAEPYL
jgi:nucleoside-diphosphate-sugar epimerase